MDDIPFGANLNLYNLRKVQNPLSMVPDWNINKYYPVVVTRRCGGASKLKFDRTELKRVATCLFEANKVDDIVLACDGPDYLDVMLCSLNYNKGTVIFVLLKEHSRHSYTIFPFFDGDKSSIYVEVL